MVGRSVLQLFFSFVLLSLAGCSTPHVRDHESSGSGPQFVADVVWQTAYCPRRTQELELALTQDFKLRQCLLGPLGQSTGRFSLQIGGRLTISGHIENLQVSAEQDEIERCVISALASFSMGRGRSGPFKTWLSRWIEGMPGKALRIEFSQSLKKFE